MQKLFVKDINPRTGASREIAVEVIRFWTHATRGTLFLHKTGVYGYKNGAPVRSAEEFEIIADPTQKKLAERWWRTVGQVHSAKYYQELEEIILAKNLQGVPELGAPEVELDAISYRRRPIKDRRRAAFSDPCLWAQWFPQRPDWWGHATVIEMHGHRYVMERLDEEYDGDEDPGAPSDTGGPSTGDSPEGTLDDGGGDPNFNPEHPGSTE